ncbi:RagB/SusD family nutrient uptake outer membrane protein [Xanthocytophaga flava]|uniref:RagB/SusD family nutrient uptake outer membrane protein n=1 Tax=Xanthocytophaga flava TaxID=3048013 RepID=UPI0028CFF5B9|nr:RagB/SusD family nutrient uptake outer membrane protein [Xanthocytophaga flavus]MDJ1473465.1 RagB/SusD family nutrient uptake outer membrane protein [Xanthocytophaga flavus]
MQRYLGFIFTLLLLTGCEDFLSKEPDNRANLDSKEKIAELLVTAYPEANYAAFCEAMSDNAEDNPQGQIQPINSDAYFWRDHSTTDQDSPEYYWNACYAAIAASNHALRAIRTAPDSMAMQALKGEALVARAYSHFMLVNLFAQTYDSATASTNPGIPYVTEPETVSFKTYKRVSVKEVYNRIERDLLDGLPLINDQAYQTNGGSSSGVPKYHFTKAASHAFASRFYLFKKEYTKVIEHANQVFIQQDIKTLLRPWNSTYRGYSAQELSLNYTKSSEKANLLLCETASNWARSFLGNRYSTGLQRYREIFNTQSMVGMYSYSVLRYPSQAYVINKFREHFVRVGTNANTGFIYTMLPLISAEEVLFNRAEAHAMLFHFNESLADINIWVSTRVTNYDPAVHTITFNKLYNYYQKNVNQQAIVAGILDFRRVEFLHEGLRWFDVLRHKLPVRHTTADGQILDLSPTDPRRVIQLPVQAIASGGLEPNPR